MNVQTGNGGNMTVILREKDTNREISVARGETVQIELEETGATGYKWHIDKLDPEYLELVAEETKTIAGKKVGTPVMRYWKIMALKKGHTEILMYYYRPWEGQDKALRHYRVKVNIL